MALGHYDSFFRQYPAQLAEHTANCTENAHAAFAIAAQNEAAHVARPLAERVAETSVEIAQSNAERPVGLHRVTTLRASVVGFGARCVRAGYSLAGSEANVLGDEYAQSPWHDESACGRAVGVGRVNGLHTSSACRGVRSPGGLGGGLGPSVGRHVGETREGPRPIHRRCISPWMCHVRGHGRERELGPRLGAQRGLVRTHQPSRRTGASVISVVSGPSGTGGDAETSAEIGRNLTERSVDYAGSRCCSLPSQPSEPCAFMPGTVWSAPTNRSGRSKRTVPRA